MSFRFNCFLVSQVEAARLSIDKHNDVIPYKKFGKDFGSLRVNRGSDARRREFSETNVGLLKIR